MTLALGRGLRTAMDRGPLTPKRLERPVRGGKPAALYRAGTAATLHPPLLRPTPEGRPA